MDVVVCKIMYYVCLLRRLSLRARSGVAGLVFAFQCKSRGHESHPFFLNLINQKIRSKCVLNGNMWCQGGSR